MKNTFKQALKERAQIGLWLSLAHAYPAEICATAQYDWLLIDGEHAPNNVQTTLQQLQAVAPYASQPVVRAVTADVALIKQLLDIGAHNLLIPMIDTAEQARDMVRATRYPPEGVRGVGSAVARASRWGLEGDYLNQANDNICLLVQAETATALGNLEAICAVEGVDGVFIGPNDLAADMGHIGEIDDTAHAFAEADLVIARAGASTVTELAAIGAAAGLVLPVLSIPAGLAIGAGIAFYKRLRP